MTLTRSWILLLTVVVVISSTLGPASSGDDGSSCTYDDSSKVVQAVMGNDSAQKRIRRNQDEIQLGNIDCGDATLFNTEQIIIEDQQVNHPGSDLVIAENKGGTLIPGYSDEPGNSDEIEIVVNFHHKRNLLSVWSGSAEDSITGGTQQIDGETVELVNLNTEEQDGVDADVFVNGGLYSLSIDGGKRADSISMSGGLGTGQPMAIPGHLDGASGTDHVIGGDGDDTLSGGDGTDFVGGGRGDDRVTGGRGPDVLEGHDGEDDLFGANNRDQLRGGLGADKLLGQEGVDNVEGGPGDDVLEGGPGVDNLEGGPGDDVLRGGSDRDALIGGTGFDTCYGRSWEEIDCEEVIIRGARTGTPKGPR